MLTQWTKLAYLAFYFASPIFAQSSSSTISLFIPEADPQPLVASVIGVGNGAITYAIQCEPGTDSDNCGIPAPWSLTYGSGFYEAHYTEQGAFSVSDRCTFEGTTVAICTISLGGSKANFQGASSETLSGSELTSMPVVITAGLEKLSATATAGAPATTTVASATSESRVVGTGDSVQTASSNSLSASATGTHATHSPNSAAHTDVRMGISLAAVISIFFSHLVF